MKIKITRNSLVEGLAVVKDACEGKDALNILRCVKLVTGDGEVTLAASNLDITVTAKVACEVLRPGEVALVGSSLFGFANALPEGNVEIELGNGATKASIAGGSCRYALAAGEVDQWPKMATIGGNDRPVTTYALKGQTLRELFRKTKYAASTDSTRKILNGVNLSTKNGTLTVVATDGRRLSFCEVEVGTEAESVYTLTSKTVSQLEKMIGKENADVEIVTDGLQVLFAESGAKWTLQSRLVDGIYPNWRQVVPKEFRNEATVDRAVFKEELQRVSLSAELRGTDKYVKITVEPGRLLLESTDGDYSRARTEMPVRYDGEKVSVSINPDLARDILGCVDEDEMTVAFNDGHNPIVFKPQIPFLGIVMPMRAN